MTVGAAGCAPRKRVGLLLKVQRIFYDDTVGIGIPAIAPDTIMSWFLKLRSSAWLTVNSAAG
jgi:hypothetical protein